MHRNFRLRDKIKRGGDEGKSKNEPSNYPLEGGDWSSCDESEDEAQEPDMAGA